MPERKDIGYRIRLFRKSKNLNAKEFAEKYGLVLDNLYKWEKGTKPSDPEDYKKLESILENVPSAKNDHSVDSEELENALKESPELTNQILLQLLSNQSVLINNHSVLITNQNTLVNTNSKLVDTNSDLTQIAKSKFTVDALIQNQSDGPSIIDRILDAVVVVGVPKLWATKEAGLKVLRKIVYGDTEALIAVGRSHE